MSENTVLNWVILLMVVVGFILIGLTAFKYNETAGWGFGMVGIGFFTITRMFNALKGGV